MENFKQASQQKLRFQTNKGLLSVEQLWDLSLEDLDHLAVILETEHKQSGRKSFILKTSEKDKVSKLRFDVVLEVLNTKLEEAEAQLRAQEIKEHNKKIIALIADKKDESLKKKSIKQLEDMLQ